MWTQLAIVASIVSLTLAQQCSPLHLVYARATTEPPQNYGSNFDSAAGRTWSKGYGAAGYSLYSNMTALVQGSTGYPVHYPAAWGGNSPQDGVRDMIKQLTDHHRACPQQKFALGGHSQGGFVTADAIPKIPQDVLPNVVAVTIFGGPACPGAVRGRCISYCQAGDSACARGGGGKGAGPKGTMRTFENDATLAKDLERRMAAAAPDCARLSGLATTGLGKGGHLGYNADGTYVRAAACFIAAKFGGRGG